MEGRGWEVARGLHRIEPPLGHRFVACSLVVGDDAALLVDTGVATTPTRSILPYTNELVGHLEELVTAAVVVAHPGRPIRWTMAPGREA